MSLELVDQVEYWWTVGDVTFKDTSLCLSGICIVLMTSVKFSVDRSLSPYPKVLPLTLEKPEKNPSTRPRTRLTEHKRATRNDDVINHIAEYHLPERNLTSEPTPRVQLLYCNVWRKTVFWTWLEEMFISSNMRVDISLLNVYCGAAMIEVCLWSKNSVIRWVFGPQTAFE